MKKQGANDGACLAFLIATPETGVDSIALTYSLLDPVMAIIRPLTAFCTAVFAGTLRNFAHSDFNPAGAASIDKTCPVDGCCDGVDCDPKVHARHHTYWEKMAAGLQFAFNELMTDLTKWFILGVFLAGAITALVPDTWIHEISGQGLVVYLGVLFLSLPMYVCATLSTPIAAALIMKGLSPGAALVLLIAGPATNIATVTMVAASLGKRTLLIYLGAIVSFTLAFAYLTDWLYAAWGLPIPGMIGAEQSTELWWLETVAAVILGILMLRSVWKLLCAKLVGAGSMHQDSSACCRSGGLEPAG